MAIADNVLLKSICWHKNYTVHCQRLLNSGHEYFDGQWYLSEKNTVDLDVGKCWWNKSDCKHKGLHLRHLSAVLQCLLSVGRHIFCGLLGNGRKIRRKKELQLPDETEGASNTTICILEDNRFYWIYCLRSLLNAKNKKREGRKTQLKGDFLSFCCFNHQKKRLYSRKKEVEKNVFYFSVNF